MAYSTIVLYLKFFKLNTACLLHTNILNKTYKNNSCCDLQKNYMDLKQLI
jgi:hypothetical protein